MSGFSAEWLHLREPFDHAARETVAVVLELPGRLARWRKPTPAHSYEQSPEHTRQRTPEHSPGHSPELSSKRSPEHSPGETLAVVDLACGHGANLRALAPRLGGAQHWRLVDHDAALLAAVPDALAGWARRCAYQFTLERAAGDEPTICIAGPDFHATVVCQRVDLARDLASLEFGQAPLVTASALLDLVSAPWLQALIHQARAARAALWFGLTVDGRVAWNPVDPNDELVRELFAQHQRRDKGFGPAMGSQAAAVAMQQLANAGYETLQAPTDWVIDSALAAPMLRAMVEGLAAAALEQNPGAQDAVRSWKARREAGIGSSRLRVGHVDILATPVGPAQLDVRKSRSHR